MDEPKTKSTTANVDEFLGKIQNPQRKEDGYELLRIMGEITGEDPVLWGPSIVGFGSYHYKYESGQEGDMALTGFSPRAKSLSVYIMSGFDGYEGLLKRLGKHKVGKSCLYINRLSDIDISVLRKIIEKSVESVRDKGPVR